MIYRKIPILAIGALMVLLLLTLYTRPRPVPQTLFDVFKQARDVGLFGRGDSEIGALQYRLVVSDRPLDFECVNDLRFGMPYHRCWEGVAAICFPTRAWAIECQLCEPSRSLRWGKMFVFGDPAIIRKLTGQTPPGTSSQWWPFWP